MRESVPSRHEAAVSGGRMRGVAEKGFALGVPVLMLTALAAGSVAIFEGIGICLGLFG